MSWQVIPICNACGFKGEKYKTRTQAANRIKDLGWLKGPRPGWLLCPSCSAKLPYRESKEARI